MTNHPGTPRFPLFRSRNLLVYGFFLIGMLGVLSACKKDDDDDPQEGYHNGFLVNNEIVVSNIGGIPGYVNISKVKAEITGVDWQVIEIIEASYGNGSITLSLPTEFSSEKLQKAVRDSWDDYTGYWPAQKTDDPQAKVARLNDIIAYNADNQKVGRIYLTDWPGEGSKLDRYYIYYQYADRNFTLSGYNLISPASDQYSYSYALSFKTGWNYYGELPQEIGGLTLCTTAVDQNTSLGWYFESWVYPTAEE